MAKAIRCHWGVESNNWIRDVTFNEGHIKTKAGHQAQIMALLRGLAIELIRKTSPKNFQAAIENFAESVPTLIHAQASKVFMRKPWGVVVSLQALAAGRMSTVWAAPTFGKATLVSAVRGSNHGLGCQRAKAG
ncbi:MAG: hypothetical protein PHR16_12540 [Methylovulum sp.]|nr:hypothetical protein [Methylovulum sp.]